MPIYEYACLKCGKRVEMMQKISDAPLTVCPDCGGTMSKLMSSTSFVLKGTGWYKTDYAKDKKKPETKPTEAKPSEAKDSDAKPAESKPKETEKASSPESPKAATGTKAA